MKEIREFSVKREQAEMKARWAFVELNADALKQISALEIESALPKVGIEFLSINIEFNRCIEMCWNWHHKDHLVVQEFLYSVANGEMDMNELLEELGGFDGNYQTTKDDRMKAVDLLVELNTEIQAVTRKVGVLPFWGE